MIKLSLQTSKRNVFSCYFIICLSYATAQNVMVVETNNHEISKFPIDNISRVFFEKEPLDKSNFGQAFQEEFGIIDYSQDWNMAEEQAVRVTTSVASTICIFGTFVSSEFGSRKLAEYNDVIGTQDLKYQKPKGLKELFAIASNPNFSVGAKLDDSGIVDFDKVNADVVLQDCVTSETVNVEVDHFALQTLPNGQNNQGKVSQSSQFISDGRPITITPVYSDCGYQNTLGIYVQKGSGELLKMDLWTKRQNHTNGVQSLPAFQVTLPVGLVYGFYIANISGTYYSDASLNSNEARAAGIFRGNEKMYMAFEDMPLLGDMDYNDMVFSIEPEVTALDTDPSEWIIAVELDEEDSDFDFNDVVVKVSYAMGTPYLTLTPMAAGTTKRVEIYMADRLLSEIHQLFGTQETGCINTIADGTIYRGFVNTTPIRIEVPNQYSIKETLHNLSIHVDNNVLSVSKTGWSPRFLLISNGLWRWPTEGTSIGTAYEGFAKWVQNPNNFNWIFE